MIWVDTDILEEMDRLTGYMEANCEEIRYRIRRLSSEIAEDARIQADAGAAVLQGKMDVAAGNIEKLGEFLTGLKRVMVGLPGGYREMEARHIKRISCIGEVMRGMEVNLRTAVLSDERMVLLREGKTKEDAESFFNSGNENIEMENLAAVTQILKEYYHYSGVQDAAK